MVEEEPVERRALARCQHCFDLIEAHGTMWMGQKNKQVVCDPKHIGILHKPMPRIPA